MDSKKAKHVIAKVQEKKGMSSIADMQTQLQKQLRSEAMRDILNTALLGAGVAGTVRGGQGLWNLLTRSHKKLSNRPGVAPLPVPYRPSYQEENGEEKEAEFFKGVYNKTFGGGGTGIGKAMGQIGAGARQLVPHGTVGARQAASQYGKNYDAREAAQQTLGDKQLANTGAWWKGLGQDIASPFTAAKGYLGGLFSGGHQAGTRQAGQAWNAGDRTRAAGQQGVAAAQRSYDQAIAKMNPAAGSPQLAGSGPASSPGAVPPTPPPTPSGAPVASSGLSQKPLTPLPGSGFRSDQAPHSAQAPLPNQTQPQHHQPGYQVYGGGPTNHRRQEWDDIHSGKGFEYDPDGRYKSLGPGEQRIQQRNRWDRQRTKEYAKKWGTQTDQPGGGTSWSVKSPYGSLDLNEKRSFVTPAMLIGGGIGAGYGAGTAPKGEVVQNMTHHGARGLGAGAGSSLGSLLGAGGGIGVANLIAKLRGTEASPRSQGIGALAGLLTGGIGGGILGNKATKALLGKSPKEREGKEDEQIEVLLQRAQQARQEGEDNNGFSFRKYSADKQAVDMPKPGPTSKPGLWWYMPAMLGAGTLGGYGGWKLIDHILDKRRRQEIDDEVDESRNEFQEALMSQYKRGSDSELGVALDELYNKMNKEALDLDSIVSPDTRGRALGAYATYAIPSSILGYLLVKGLADRGSRGKILEKAQRSRALKQQQSRPAELYAVPTPIDEEEE